MPLTGSQLLVAAARARWHLLKASGHLFRAATLLRLLGPGWAHRLDVLVEWSGATDGIRARLEHHARANHACETCGLTGGAHDSACSVMRALEDEELRKSRRLREDAELAERTGSLVLRDGISANSRARRRADRAGQ